jgi:hypothetical protein
MCLKCIRNQKDEHVKLADETEFGLAPFEMDRQTAMLWKDQVTVYLRMPQDRAGCVARSTQAEKVKEETTEIFTVRAS